MSSIAVRLVSTLPVMAIVGRQLLGFRAEAPLPVEELGRTEREQYDALPYEGRRVEWLTGRAAAKAASAAASITDDESLLSPPHVRLSLSHVPGASIAVSVEAARSGQDYGLGIDFERDRPMPERALRLFGTDGEAAMSCWQAGVDVLRLWTIKEAVFKACPHNDGRLLTDFQVRSPSLDGTAEAIELVSGARFLTATHRYEAGWLSVALCVEIQR